jgi:hypothetical protein
MFGFYSYAQFCADAVWAKGARDSAVVKALWYMLGGHGFETKWGELIFAIYLILPAALGSGVYSASNKWVPEAEK